ncbi:hypothetical protein Tco_0790748 [Tanacetum coccineum]
MIASFLVSIGPSMRIESNLMLQSKKHKGTTDFVTLGQNEHQRASGLFTAVEDSLLENDEISMDFVTGFEPTTRKDMMLFGVLDEVNHSDFGRICLGMCFGLGQAGLIDITNEKVAVAKEKLKRLDRVEELCLISIDVILEFQD